MEQKLYLACATLCDMMARLASPGPPESNDMKHNMVFYVFDLCSGGEQDPVTAVSQIEDRIANNTAFKVNCWFI